MMTLAQTNRRSLAAEYVVVGAHREQPVCDYRRDERSRTDRKYFHIDWNPRPCPNGPQGR